MKEHGLCVMCLAMGLFCGSSLVEADPVTVNYLLVSEDANPDQGYGSGGGANAYSWMYPGSASGYSVPSNTNNWASILIAQWNLPDSGGKAIDSVTSATAMFVVSGDYSYVGKSYSIYRLTSAFDEDTVTWDTKPAIDTSASVTWTPDASIVPNAWAYLDVSDLLAGNGDLSTFGFAVIQTGGGMHNLFALKESGGAPMLSASYTTVPEPSMLIMGLTGLMGLFSIRRVKK